MAGYVPESTKEIQALLVKAYADTVLNAFLGAPELLAMAPVGGRMGYDEQIEYLREQEKSTRQERQDFTFLCDIALIEGELMLRYARNRKLAEGDISWLEDKIRLYEMRATAGMDSRILQGLRDLLGDVKSGNFIARAGMKKEEAQRGVFSFGGSEWSLHPKSPVREYLEFLYSVAEGFDPGDVAELQRRNYEVSGLADVARHGYEILIKLCEKAKKLDVPIFVGAVIPKGYLAKARKAYEAGKTPKPMYKPVVLSGPPGVGKTAMLREIANWTNTNLFSFSMAQMDAASFGFPVYDSVTGSAKRDILDDMKNTVKKPGVVLLDEMNRTGTDVQSKLLTYLLDHKVSGFTVHPLSLVVGAENPVSSDPYGTMTKSIAMIDRCTYIDMSDYDMITKGWFEWLDEEYGDVMAENDLLRSFIRFLKEEPPLGARDIILKIPDDPEENPGFPTPRSIDAAIVSIILSHGDRDTAISEVSANAGSELANRFASYLDVIQSLPSPQELAEKADEIQSVLAAIAVDSDMKLVPDGVEVVGFEKGLFNTINGFNDGKRKGKKQILESYSGKDNEFRKFLENLTPEVATEQIGKYTHDLYFSKSAFTVGVEAEMADSILAAFQKSFRESIENDKPIDGVFLGNLFKAACFFPIPTARNNLLNMMERTILFAPWKEEYSEVMKTLDKLCKAEVNTRRGKIKLNEESPVRAFFTIVSPSPWLIKISRRFEDTFKEVTEILAEKDDKDAEVGIG
jgi:hypothetical protein